MASRTKSTLTEEFYEEQVTLRGTTYTFREISAEKYEEILKLSEGEDGSADLATVLRLMIPESLVDPKLTAEQLYRKPMPVVTAIQNLVNRMHFTPAAEETKDEEEGAGNESEAPTS